MGSPRDKQYLLELLYEAKEALAEEKASAWDKFHAEADRVLKGTSYSRSQIKDMLHKDGYIEYAKRRRIAERGGI